MVQNGFSVGFRNMQGMHNSNVCKINEIVQELSNDIEILAETCGCKCELNFENYFLEYVAPQNRMGIKKGLDSGAFIILFKNNLAKNVKIIKKSNNFVWIEVDKRLISGSTLNSLIAGVYIHDITSKYYDDSIFEELNRDILKFSDEGTPVLLMGDINARTGNLNDNYEDSAHADQHIPISNTFTNIPNRTRFTWDNKSAKKFATNLLANENDIDEISQRLDAGSIDSTGKIIQDLYFQVAKKTLEQKGAK